MNRQATAAKLTAAAKSLLAGVSKFEVRFTTTDGDTDREWTFARNEREAEDEVKRGRWDVDEVIQVRKMKSNDEWMTREQVAEICPTCADVMAAKGMCRIRMSVVEEARQAAWDKLPKGWTQASVKKFWESLTGDRKHKVTACIKKMKDKFDDPGAFCASLADKVDPGWRSRDK